MSKWQSDVCRVKRRGKVLTSDRLNNCLQRANDSDPHYKRDYAHESLSQKLINPKVRDVNRPDKVH